MQENANDANVQAKVQQKTDPDVSPSPSIPPRASQQDVADEDGERKCHLQNSQEVAKETGAEFRADDVPQPTMEQEDNREAVIARRGDCADVHKGSNRKTQKPIENKTEMAKSGSFESSEEDNESDLFPSPSWADGDDPPLAMPRKKAVRQHLTRRRKAYESSSRRVLPHRTARPANLQLEVGDMSAEEEDSPRRPATRSLAKNVDTPYSEAQSSGQRPPGVGERRLTRSSNVNDVSGADVTRKRPRVATSADGSPRYVIEEFRTPLRKSVRDAKDDEFDFAEHDDDSRETTEVPAAPMRFTRSRAAAGDSETPSTPAARRPRRITRPYLPQSQSQFVYRTSEKVPEVLQTALFHACYVLFKHYRNVIMEWGVHLGFSDQGARLMMAVDRTSLEAIRNVGFITLGDRSQQFLSRHKNLAVSFPKGPVEKYVFNDTEHLSSRDVVCLDGTHDKECREFLNLFSDHIAPDTLKELADGQCEELAEAARTILTDSHLAEMEVQNASKTARVRCSFAQLSLQQSDFGNHVDQVCVGFRKSPKEGEPMDFIGGDGPGRFLFTRTVKGYGKIALYKNAGVLGHAWRNCVRPFLVGPGDGYGLWGEAREQWSHEVWLVDGRGRHVDFKRDNPVDEVPEMAATPRVSVTYRLYRGDEVPVYDHTREQGLQNLRLHLSGHFEDPPPDAATAVRCCPA
eukprot:Plantae.Rhodophyta-Rhodochaete_pulchella.ctg894.p1 GENE.Plantae.Rhodophyta-Rhodochaete_pulchella.ctg894~~Plantae.Rhodophyta-Rhodochaete_pulchella.ctg894.p1  ORF type:complete len:697 (+),score=90.61 Plantae.Rhodophyta-Rhodochaete_pulchella.ctg894:29-2092(+)